MFLNYLKEFSVKKILKNILLNKKSNSFSGKIKTIGLLVDESYLVETKFLVEELKSYGFLEEDIDAVIYKSKLKSQSKYSKTTFSSRHLKWNAKINNKSVNEFINKEFDLLISYYDIEKSILLIVTHESKAKFKVGFSSIDKRLNDLMINTNIENYKVFIGELIRYLKILNKI
jgi:hypothetical protein